MKSKDRQIILQSKKMGPVRHGWERFNVLGDQIIFQSSAGAKTI